MGLCLFFLPNFPGATFIQGATFIPESRVVKKKLFSPIVPRPPASNARWYSMYIHMYVVSISKYAQ